eukprot:10592265-Alexandrium_andersonii.AAC.1
MELLAAERSKEAELLSLLVGHQVQAGSCVLAAVEAGGAQVPGLPGALWCRVKFDGCQFGLKCLGERAWGTGRDEKLVLGKPLA